MYNRVSRQLRDKMENDLQEVCGGDKRDTLIMSFTSEEEHLRQECIEWREVINLFYLTSYSGGALKKFLCYDYIRPKEIARFTVTFDYEINWNPSWKDWFIDRGDHASIVTS
jgi:hypothetical protein